jgi:hypothetical protein
VELDLGVEGSLAKFSLEHSSAEAAPEFIRSVA